MKVGRSGFSLLELLLVTSMISMICGLGIMRLGNALAGFELSASALELATDLRWMQQISVNSPVSAGGPFYSMVFNQATGSYHVKAGTQICKRAYLPASVRFATLPASLYFSENGNPSAAQTIVLQNSKLGKNLYVVIAAVSGRVRVSESASWE